MNQDSLYSKMIRSVKEYHDLCVDSMEGAGGDEFEQAETEAALCFLFLRKLRQQNPKDFDECQSHK